MIGFKNFIQWQTHRGPKVTVGDISLTPEAQAIILRWKGGGLVWNRPVAVLIEQDNRTMRAPIVDVTRLAQISLWGLSAAMILNLLIVSRKFGRINNER